MIDFGRDVCGVSEIFDGDPPFTPRGCIAQAWGRGRAVARLAGDTGCDGNGGSVNAVPNPVGGLPVPAVTAEQMREVDRIAVEESDTSRS